jgi:hypothetical protein
MIKDTQSLDIEKEIKKYPRKERKKLRLLLEEYNKGKVLRPNEDVDNKEYIKSQEIL